jgi:hypothetical protein
MPDLPAASPPGRPRQRRLEKETMTTAAAATNAAAEEKGLIDQVYAFIQTAKARAADGLTWGEFGELLLALLRLVVPFLDNVKTMTGVEKKAFALDAVGRLFDAVADFAIPTTVYPLWILVRPAVRTLVLAIAGGVLEQYLSVFRGK